jgi:hypothetical protein
MKIDNVDVFLEKIYRATERIHNRNKLLGLIFLIASRLEFISRIYS